MYATTTARAMIAAFLLGVCTTVAVAALPGTVQTPPLQMTGIGDTIPPAGPAPTLPASVTASELAFTGIGDTIAPLGPVPNLPAVVQTQSLIMTGIGQ
jgi:hypothetical protein